MKHKIANYSRNRGQLKIQEMAFVIVAMVVFFGLVSLFLLSVSFSGLKDSVQEIKDESARGLVSSIAGSPEFSSSICSSCIDKDKIFLLKKRISNYSNFWNVDYMAIKTIYPDKSSECNNGNYPNCGSITLINKTAYFGVPSEAYVSICYRDYAGINKCDLGVISASIRRTG